MHNDLNFFAISKSGSSKGAGGKSILLPILFFLLIIGSAYGYISFVKMDTENQINAINKELQQTKYVDADNAIKTKGGKNKNLKIYLNGLEAASENFKKTAFINSELFNNIKTAIPSDVNYLKINITGRNISMECTCKTSFSPVEFTKNLKAKEIFSNISYSDISKSPEGVIGSVNAYNFSITFTIK